MKQENGGDDAAEKTTASKDARIEPDARLAQLEQENAGLREVLKIRDAREAMIGELRKAGARSPALLFAHSVTDLEFDANGSVTNAPATVEKLRRDHPEQFGRDVQALPIDAGARGPSTRTLTKETLAKMKPAEIAKLDWAEVRSVLANP